MSLPTSAPSAVPSVLRITTGDLDAAATGSVAGARYRALLTGPAGSGTVRAVTLDGDAPHDLIVVEYGDGSHWRTWLRGDPCADGVVYSLLAEIPTSFPMRAPAIMR
ncbi:hypothetical protein [Leifsonia sp. 21MFCrub1.1]|uniref:hypothetical protein n=1 Tax=Leifsonia sp. 21MFCrub1.1 TaxID=1798223 RepID=UPI00089283D0|nr:hypothetical protein [Leifsonia sp. 21MFCrub1.1]SEB07910.1 hypothetical protein SAMN04515680_3087 [Leifsonia sp. 21MFCrub1.1]